MDEPGFGARFVADNPSVRFLEAFVIDVNGIARGKWIPGDRIAAVLDGGMAMPRSVYALDIWDRDVGAAGLASGTGDPDALARTVRATAATVPWLTTRVTQVLMSVGGPATAVARFTALGLTPVVALELEFYLLERRGAAEPARPPGSSANR